MRTTPAKLPWLIVLTAITAAALLGTASRAHAATSVEGAADFRTAPLITSGSYEDHIVAGETVWYAVLYTNNATYHVDAHLVGDQGPELTLHRLFIGPSLSVVADQTKSLGGTAYRNGGDPTNVWYVAFRLDTTGQLGVKHELDFDVTGFAPARTGRCDTDPQCKLDDQLSDVGRQVNALEDTTKGGVKSIADLRTQRQQLRAHVDASKASIKKLCGGEDCDHLSAPSSTPWIPVLVLAVAAALCIVAAVRATARRSSPARPRGRTA